jgi:hypothetical protein
MRCERERGALHESPRAAPSQWGQSCSWDQSRTRATEPPGAGPQYGPGEPRNQPACRRPRSDPVEPRRCHLSGLPERAMRHVAALCGAPAHRSPGDAGGEPTAHKCTSWPMVSGFGLAHPQAMRQQRTPRRSRGDHPVLPGAVRYGFPMAVVGAGMLLIGLSPGVGWALIVFGASLAARTSQRPPRRRSGTDPAHLGSARRESHRARRAGGMDHRKRGRATTVARPASRGHA